MNRKVLWTCSKFPGGVHWYASIDVLAEDGTVEQRIEHLKFRYAPRAALWIQDTFASLGPGFDLWDWEELICGVRAMTVEIYRRKEAATFQ